MEHPEYRVDAALAGLSDAEVEARWRHALSRGDNDEVQALARQLVLRALPIIERTCRLGAKRAGVGPCECEKAIEEAAIKLLLRLIHDGSWRFLNALAAETSRACIDDPRRRRPEARPPPVRPRLRLIDDKRRRTPSQREERDDDGEHGCS